MVDDLELGTVRRVIQADFEPGVDRGRMHADVGEQVADDLAQPVLVAHARSARGGVGA